MRYKCTICDRIHYEFSLFPEENFWQEYPAPHISKNTNDLQKVRGRLLSVLMQWYMIRQWNVTGYIPK